jgi:glycosyltransferase involved in cell wall biosynthesis
VDVAHCVDSYHLQHPKDPEIRFAEHPNVTRYELRSPFKWLSPLLTQQTGRPFLKRQTIQSLLDENRYDVVHFHNTSLLGPGMMAMEPTGGRVVKMYTTHEHWLICPTHVLWKFNRRPCEKPDCFRCTLMAKRPPQLWRYTGYLAEMSRHVDRFVAPSRFTARMHAERGFTEPVEHLPYFIDRVDDEWQNPEPRPHAAPYFLFVGRLEYIKGLHTLIDTWSKVTHADLLVAGAGTQAADLKGAGCVQSADQVPRSAQPEAARHAVSPRRGEHRAVDHVRNVRHDQHRVIRTEDAGDRARPGRARRSRRGEWRRIRIPYRGRAARGDRPPRERS